MAKSLRSKWKRKMRAEKRVRYGEKEKVRLLNMLDEAKAAKENPIVRVTRIIRTREPEKEEGEVLKFPFFYVEGSSINYVSHGGGVKDFVTKVYVLLYDKARGLEKGGKMYRYLCDVIYGRALCDIFC